MINCYGALLFSSNINVDITSSTIWVKVCAPVTWRELVMKFERGYCRPICAAAIKMNSSALLTSILRRHRLPLYTVSFLLSTTLAGSIAFAHPGRLNDIGCHKVTQDWKYKSGKVLKAGTYHCHGRLNDFPLDGTQILEDPNDKGEPVKKKDKK